eukprot:4857263-Karenia_brevis.AAC.1
MRRKAAKEAAAKNLAGSADVFMDDDTETPCLVTPDGLSNFAQHLQAAFGSQLGSSSSTTTTTTTVFAPGTRVRIHGLAARMDIEGATGLISGESTSSDGVRQK